MARPDLTVRGAGILGLSVAWAAARRGAFVRVIETVGIGAGASGGVIGALSPHVPEQWNAKKQFQFESLLMAEAWWAEVEAASGLSSGYGRTGRLQALRDAKAVHQARERVEDARRFWQGKAVWEVVEFQSPLASPSPSGLAVHDDLTARVNPKSALAALVGAIREKGGEVIVGETESVGPVVWATGLAGLQDLNAALGSEVGGGVKGQALLLAHDVRTQPQLFVDGLHIVPHADGTVAVGSTSERVWDDPVATDAQLAALHEKAVTACPALAASPVLARWAGVRPRTKSRAPMLGAWPGRAGQFIANGGFKIAFGIAPKVAEVMVDLVLEGRDLIPQEFRIEASF